jgi:predicted DNA-binding transcriptional regulator AlpA
VARRTGYSPAHFCRLERRGLFPKRVRLTPGTGAGWRGGAVGWFEDEIDEWLAAPAAERDRVVTDRQPPAAVPSAA